jgi:hypothetical protein
MQGTARSPFPTRVLAARPTWAPLPVNSNLTGTHPIHRARAPCRPKGTEAWLLSSQSRRLAEEDWVLVTAAPFRKSKGPAAERKRPGRKSGKRTANTPSAPQFHLNGSTSGTTRRYPHRGGRHLAEACLEPIDFGTTDCGNRGCTRYTDRVATFSNWIATHLLALVASGI